MIQSVVFSYLVPLPLLIVLGLASLFSGGRVCFNRACEPKRAD
jgi:hypothetical protein